MIKLINISKKFGEREIFSNLNLQFEEGKTYALIGASGSGKTTLLNMIGNLESVDNGDIEYNKKSIKDISMQYYFRHYLGYLFQNFGLIDNQTIHQNLNLGLIGKKINKLTRQQLQKQVLKQVGLDYLSLDDKIYTLSGGEAQRVALAKIILKDPPIILADEPTASLDSHNANEVIDLLISLKNNHKIIIIATHNPEVWHKVDEVIEVKRE